MTGCGLPADGPGPWHLDLRRHLADHARKTWAFGAVTRLRLVQRAHDRHSFYSHRASGGTDGRMVAYLRRCRVRIDSIRLTAVIFDCCPGGRLVGPTVRCGGVPPHFFSCNPDVCRRAARTDS